MAQFRKKATVEAVQFDGKTLVNGAVNGGDRPTTIRTTHGRKAVPPGHGLLPTLHGPHLVAPGDWIVTEDGAQYPVKPDVFAATFEPVDPAAPATAPPAVVQPAAPPVAVTPAPAGGAPLIT